ncbi:glycoside hydrolase family 15 protein [Cohnella candidum]|uniref:Glycoside hydrolase family 15 protein n=1 Tax=Cohnella candidum TaxID=2674991 RepID=A0A3G3JXC8_9BACL|nr:glycoside hydrolase family 15 protein [Cohnella candidum]AYQ72875.1 glycoside hydrolase family 15 protein [Cohnella candidum]
MARHLVIGNGKMLINLDRNGFIRDLYFPYVGQLNHVGGQSCRFGLWVDGAFSWLDDPAWRIEPGYVEDSLVTNVTARNDRLGIELQVNDGVHQRDSIYLKRVVVRNLWDSPREVRVFFHQDLMIDGNEVGDTAAFYPGNRTVFHYKRSSYFMFNGKTDSGGIHQFSTGIKRFHSAEGTWRDAEDGELAGNAIAQGSVDSAISFRASLAPGGESTVYYWCSVGSDLEEVKALDQYVQDSHPEKLLSRIVIYWNHWLSRVGNKFGDLPASVIHQFKHSLLIVRTQIDDRGAILAANDSDILQYNRDHYSYMWPRDGALIADAMSLAGFHGTIAPFFHFCARVLSPDGYLYHKYNPDGTVGSSWHPYVVQGVPRLPIQEDETALVLYALWMDYARHGEIELPQSLYSKFVRKAAEFLCDYMEPSLGLPRPSYDLWEERFGIWTYTAASVYGGLMGAAYFADLFGDYDRSDQYRAVADRVKSGILDHLWDEEAGRFARGLVWRDGSWVKDMTLESSLFGLFEFGVLPAEDARVASTMEAIATGLSVKTEIGGIARYAEDYYFRVSDDPNIAPGNPWVICTLWLAKYRIETARGLNDLEEPRRTLEKVAAYALPGGNLPEQLHPIDGSPLSVAPLTWSHATYVQTVCLYVRKREQLSSSAAPAERETGVPWA